MKSGRLYVVGVGPGDPELLTLKGMRILNQVSCIIAPKGRKRANSLALSIVKRAVNLDQKDVIEVHFPMVKTGGSGKAGGSLDPELEAIAKSVTERLCHGTDVAFITVGDPTIYSTFFYVCDRLLHHNQDLHVEIIPGVSSINASAAESGTSLGLGDEKIAILPATYVENLREILERFDTVVLLKVHSVFDRVLRLLEEMGLARNAVYVSRVGMENQRIVRDITNLKGEEMDYFSLVIVKK
jgi:precorrin-2/cobalt-factor-2 C20-methyltransferase